MANANDDAKSTQMTTTTKGGAFDELKCFANHFNVTNVTDRNQSGPPLMFEIKIWRARYNEHLNVEIYLKSELAKFPLTFERVHDANVEEYLTSTQWCG